MARITDAITADKNAGSPHNPVLNLTHGGQNGIMPRIGMIGPDGKNYEEWINNQAYVKKNIIPVVLTYPKFFDLAPNKTALVAIYKALIELHPLTIDGLASGLTVETDSHPIGGAGEEQEEITDVKRAKSSLSFTFKEKAGKSIQKFLDFVIRYGYMDPDVKRPLIEKYIPGTDLAAIGGMYTPDFYTGSCLFIEPDTTQRQVVDAWLCANMFFKSNGDRTGKRDLRSAGETLELSIESSSITMNNEAVLQLADTVLKNMTILKLIPDTDLKLPVSDIDPTVVSAQTGFNQK